MSRARLDSTRLGKARAAGPALDSPSLFNYPTHPRPPHTMPRTLTGAVLRDEGLRAVAETEDAAGTWRTDALAWVEGRHPGERFTSEQLREMVGDPVRPNAMGSVFNTAARRGLITEVGSWKAERPGMHATRLVVWQRT